MLSNRVYLESLLDLFYKHIAICCKAVHGEYSAVGPGGVREQHDRRGAREGEVNQEI